jgi:hypothetical protein
MSTLPRLPVGVIGRHRRRLLADSTANEYASVARASGTCQQPAAAYRELLCSVTPRIRRVACSQEPKTSRTWCRRFSCRFTRSARHTIQAGRSCRPLITDAGKLVISIIRETTQRRQAESVAGRSEFERRAAARPSTAPRSIRRAGSRRQHRWLAYGVVETAVSMSICSHSDDHRGVGVPPW